jgi:hypothetical protein
MALHRDRCQTFGLSHLGGVIGHWRPRKWLPKLGMRRDILQILQVLLVRFCGTHLTKGELLRICLQFRAPLVVLGLGYLSDI